MISLTDIRNEALGMLYGAAEGAPLDAALAELMAFAVAISVTALDQEQARRHASQALALGATPAQLHEASLLVSGLGVHSLFVGTRLVAELAGGAAQSATPALDAQRQQQWDQWVGTDTYWNGFEQEVPGFLRALLQASPAGFEAFFRYCAVPWQNPQLTPLAKELIALATDATPTHRFLPGMRLHLRNALKLGAGYAEILQTLQIASAAPVHAGVA